MSEVTVTVRGEHEARVAPERATIRVGVRADGPERTAVVENAMRLAEPVRSSITDRADAGSVVEWTSKRLSVRAERPWSNDGKRLAPVYYASIDFTATFAEASDLSIWVSDISPWDGVEVGWVDWHLTTATRAQVERDVAAAAVGVAVARAEAYAGALGLDEVTPLEIADVGLISSGQPSPGAPMLKVRGGVAFAADTAPAMEYEPEEIVISATVEARFLAR
ncbi:SIMPL domain-containing protein [Microbacterium maritypicum]|uniref:SIMPL domain-containing protein n=1 Tax=Microbacterium maritypicum TaxID=33918 RepID=A0ACD4B1Q3_MICMQ|nr:SIMPL domain-containing protein [Microbacterium liquefaciens]MBP5801880.1 SIMPL domain-containing protein [Microbacterium liquefaciens]UTT51471.1 SIMPL domain-containing protein [Microbacterium liquefaciens]